MNKIHQLIRFLTADIWRIRASRLKKRDSFLINQLRIILLAVRGFNEDKCLLWASALTYYTMLSIVPIVAMAFGIAKGFGLEQMLEKQLHAKMVGQEEIISQVIGFAHSFLENTKGGVIAGVGVALLFWTVVKMLGNIENSFNDIWGIKKGRTFGRKLSDYLSIMLICPILLIMSSSVTVLIASQIKMIIAHLAFLGPIADLILYLLKFLPYAMMWGLFSFLYIFMPNTRVNFKSGLMGGIIAGTIYQIVQFIYINFQVGVAKFGAIYGSFAALPLFLIWLQVSWLVLLFGAEIAFAEQNVDTYEFEPDCLKASHSFKRLIALSIAHLCVKRFDKAQSPVSSSEIAQELEMPVRLVREIIFELTEAGVLAEVKIDGTIVSAYQPARDIEDLTVYSVLNMLEHSGVDDIPVGDSEGVKKIKRSLEAVSKALESAPANAILRDI